MTSLTTENVLNDGLRVETSPGPLTMVIFGASGDLTRRKLMPAIYRLARGRRLPAQFSVVGVGRSGLTDDAFRAAAEESLQTFANGVDGEVWPSLARHLSYVSGDYGDPDLYRRLGDVLQAQGAGRGALFYLATPPSAYRPAIEGLGDAGLSRSRDGAGDWRRIIVEKPFGHDLGSARELNHILHARFDERQVFRIDHYLGKETLQNLLVFRFGNGMFEPIWNRRYIDHVQITAAETVGVEGRAGYYEEAGALRDMVQNHLLHILALVAMEPPQEYSADEVRNRTVDAVKSVQPLPGCDPEHGVVRAHYGSGWVEGREVPGYDQEPGVAPGSMTETYVALRLSLDSWRWAGVPFYMRTGKRLPKRVTEIAIEFKRPPLSLFKHTPVDRLDPNLLIVKVQPDEGISIRFQAKLPGTKLRLAPVMMDFRYGVAFGTGGPEAYETLLLDAMLGDSTLFARHDMLEASWGLVSPVLDCWRQAGRDVLPRYQAGSWGPAEADELMVRDGRRWRTL
jgi:glucose-6-phosphate 1-dehydrogenase